MIKTPTGSPNNPVYQRQPSLKGGRAFPLVGFYRPPVQQIVKAAQAASPLVSRAETPPRRLALAKSSTYRGVRIAPV